MAGGNSGGQTVTGATIVDASISLADLDAATITALRPVALTVVPQPNFDSGSAWVNATFNTNTALCVYQICINTQIVVNKLSFYVATVNTAGVVKMSLFSEDGQTQIFSVSSASITTTGVKSIAVSAVTVNPGIYWMSILSVDTASLVIPSYGVNDGLSAALLILSVAAKPVLWGRITVTADTVPATISPTAPVGDTNTNCPIVRFDN